MDTTYGEDIVDDDQIYGGPPKPDIVDDDQVYGGPPTPPTNEDNPSGDSDGNYGGDNDGSGFSDDSGGYGGSTGGDGYGDGDSDMWSSGGQIQQLGKPKRIQDRVSAGGK